MNDDINIENDVPIPEDSYLDRSGRWNRYRRATESLEVGQSFVVGRNYSEKVKSATALARRSAKKQGVSKLFRIRVQHNNLIRVWRVE